MPDFQRRHYQAIAEAMKDTRPASLKANTGQLSNPEQSFQTGQWRQDIIAIATVFKDDNPGFNMDKFFESCGIE